MKLILATENAGKIREFREILAPMGIEAVPQRELGLDLQVEENGSSFEENAYLKAHAAFQAAGMAAVADDSGLCVQALGGAPGLYSARYGGGKAWIDSQKVEYLLQQMRGEKDRRAKFVCALVCLLPDQRKIAVRGECPGTILIRAEGDGGFGYDPIFVPDGWDQSFAQLGPQVKNRISHRARALQAFREELQKVC